MENLGSHEISILKKKIKICEKLVLCDSGNEVNYFFCLIKKPGFHIVVFVVYLSFLSYQKNSYDRYNHMET